MSKVKVLATYNTDHHGMNNIDLYDGKYYFFELSKDCKKNDFSALGNLPYKYKLKITYKGKTAIAMKAGVGPCDKNHAKIAIHITLARYLGIKNDLEYVYIEKA